MTGKKNGRGAYICHSVTCFEKAKRSKALEKSLRISIPFDVYDELEKELSESEGRLDFGLSWLSDQSRTDRKW